MAALLLALSVVPMVGAAARLASLSGPPGPEHLRFQAAPVPVVLHIAGAALFCLLGALQLPAGFRRRWPRWHRRAGWLLAPAGLVAALTGVWMTWRYAIPPGLQGPLLYWVRLAVGTGMAVAIVLGVRSVTRGQIARHQAWMLRAYALGQGAGTQALVLGPWMVLTGEGEGLTRDLLMTLAWGLNLAVAEWLIRRPPGAARFPRRPRRAELASP